ncbi:MAG: hypothetical protein WA190_13900 [Usitatibacter sp.]
MPAFIKAFVALVFVLGIGQAVNEALIKSDVAALRQQASGDLQKKRALFLSEASLADLDRVDVAVSVPTATLSQFDQLLVDSLNADGGVKSQNVHFTAADISFKDQEIIVKISATKSFGDDGDISVNVVASGLVGSTGSALMFNVVARDIKLTDVTVLRSTWTRKVAVVAINSAMDALLGIVNVILDREINGNPQRAAILYLDQKSILNQDLSQSNSAQLTFQQKTITASLRVDASAVVIDSSHIAFYAKATPVDLASLPASNTKLPADKILVEIPSEEADTRIADYQARVLAQVSKDIGQKYVDAPAGAIPFIVVTKQEVAMLLNYVFAEMPIAASGNFQLHQKASPELKVKFAAQDCNDIFNGCRFQDFCSGNRCEQSVSNVINTTCDVACCALTGLIGCVIPKICQQACTKIVQTIQPILTPECDAFRALSPPVLCNIASNLDKASCDVEKNLEKSVCDVQQEVNRISDANPFAQLDYQINLSIDYSAIVNHASIGSDLSTLSVDVDLGAKGPISVGLRYTRKLPYDSLLLLPTGMIMGVCAANWDETITFTADAGRKPYHLVFATSYANDPSSGDLVVTNRLQGHEVIFFDLSPAPLEELFVGRPQIALNCPLLVGVSILAGSFEGVFTQDDARKVLPLITGKDLPYDVSNTSFSADLTPIKVCKTIDSSVCRDDTQNVVLKPREAGSVIVYSIDPI